METRSRHWNTVYGARNEEALTWYEERPAPSLELIKAHARPGDAIIDVGGGASRLADALVAEDYGPVTVLDVSQAALEASRARLGEAGERVTWIAADITAWTPAATYALWHDRAVFHFLTDARDRAAYVAAMNAALPPGGTAIIATFAEDGPETCSGLPVVRYSPETLAKTLDDILPGRFRSIGGRLHTHITPKGNRQQFHISVFAKAK
jgi:SAM-dependent methyltransferase